MSKRNYLNFIFPLLLLSASYATAQQQAPVSSTFYSDSHGSEVHFPLGDISFADEVIYYHAGDPAPLKAKHRNTANALSIPD
ncbi:MAG: hypothetical protein ABUK13_05215, partial [Gammaproteobacteria bacterium]